MVEVDLLRQRVKVRMEDAPETISVFPNADIAILRNGKAKKNDPPIPADLAPISGSGKRVRKTEEEEKLLLEPIRFKYSTERIVEEPEEIPAENAAEPAAEAEESQAAPRSSRSRRRRNRGQGEQNKAEQPKAEAQSAPQREKKEPKPPREHKEHKDAPEAKEPAGDQAKKPHRRPNHRRHRKPKPQGDG